MQIKNNNNNNNQESFQQYNPIPYEPSNETVVLDFGSYMSKVGFANNSFPSQIFPSVLKTSRYPVSTEKHTSYEMGINAYPQPPFIGVYDLHRPIYRGMVNNWELMEILVQGTLESELRCISSSPESTCPYPIVISEHPCTSSSDQIKMAEFLFETIQVPQLCMISDAVLSLFTSHCSTENSLTGIVLDSGYESTRIVPVYEGHIIRNAVRQLNLGGKDLDHYLSKLLRDRGIDCSIPNERGITRSSFSNWGVVSRLKEQYCSVLSFDNQKENEKIKRIEVDILGHSPFFLETESTQCPELLFQPEISGIEECGIHSAIIDCILLCDEDIRPLLRSNILLSGGNTMFSGLSQRLEKEIEEYGNMSVHVKNSCHRNDCSAWMGGSALASDPLFLEKTVSQELYHEYGSRIISRAFF